VSTIAWGTPTGRGVIAAATLGSGLTLLDGTVVNVALRTMGDDLDASLAQLQWISNGYLLSLASLILLGGSLGDRLGRRRVFVVGTIWFAAASLLCGLAPNAEVLIAARVLQGIGGALLTPGSLAMIQGAFRTEDRGRAIGAWSGLGGIAAALGPLVGGLLVDHASWRWIFLINLPLAVLTVWLAIRWVPETRDPRAQGRFDVGGAVLVISQFTLLGDCRTGRRPSFIEAAEPAEADRLYRRFHEQVAAAGLTVATGVFRAQMQVELVNDGPVTLLLDSRKRF